MFRILPILTAFLAVILLACSGGGSASRSPTPSPPEIATVTPAPTVAQSAQIPQPEPTPAPVVVEEPEPEFIPKTRQIRTWEILDLWRAGDKARGDRLRVSGSAVVKPSGNGLYFQLREKPDNKTLIRAWMPREDAGVLADARTETAPTDVTLEGEVRPGGGATVTLQYARVAIADEPSEYVEYIPNPKRKAETTREPEPATVKPGESPPDKSFGTPLRTVSVPTSRSSGTPSGNKTVSVRGYTRKDGTYVQAHMRSAPRSGGGRR